MKNTKKQGIFGKSTPGNAGTMSTDEELEYRLPPGTRFVKNNQTVLGGQYSGIMKSGRSVTVSGSDNFIPVPLNYTLGSDTKQTATLGADWVDNGGDSYTASNATSSLSDLSSTSNVPVLISYTISNYSAGDLEGNTANGDYETVSNTEELKGTSFSGDVLINSVKEITQVQGSVTYQKADGTFEQIEANGIGSKELLINGDFSDGTNGWKKHDEIIFDSEKLHFKSEGTGDLFVRQLNTIGPGKRYAQKFTASNCLSGSYRFLLGDSTSGWVNATDGVHTFIGNGNYSYSMYLQGNKGCDFFVDDLSCKEALPLSTTYDLKDGTYSNIVRLWDTQFTQEDLEFFNNTPENIIRWYLGEVTIPSGLVKGANDKLYACTEESGDVLLDAGYQKGPEEFNGNFANQAYWDEVDNGDGTFTYTLTEAGGNKYCYIRLSQSGSNPGLVHDFPAGVDFELTFPITEVNISADFRVNSTHWSGIDEIVNTPRTVTCFSTSSGYTDAFIRFGGLNIDYYQLGDSFTIDVSGISIKEVDAIKIQGSYTRELNSQYGVQTLLLELNPAGVPLSVIAPGSVYGEEYIQTDFRLYPSDGFCVEEVTNLYTYAFTSDGAVWKDGVLYDSYTLPAEGTLLTLGKTLLNGNEVAQRDNTKVFTYIPDQYLAPIGKSGTPLENHPYWYKIANDASKIGWNRFGRTIVAKNHANKNESQIAIGDGTAAYQYANATITAEYLAGSTADNSYLVPFCKIINGNNLAGARMRNGKVEIVQKKNGTYSTLGSINSTELGEWQVVFDGVHIKVYINKNLALEADSTIANFANTGYYGVSDYSWNEAEKEIAMDYTVMDNSAYLIDNNGAYLVDNAGKFLIGE